VEDLVLFFPFLQFSSQAKLPTPTVKYIYSNLKKKKYNSNSNIKTAIDKYFRE